MEWTGLVVGKEGKEGEREEGRGVFERRCLCLLGGWGKVDEEACKEATHSVLVLVLVLVLGIGFGVGVGWFCLSLGKIETGIHSGFGGPHKREEIERFECHFATLLHHTMLVTRGGDAACFLAI